MSTVALNLQAVQQRMAHACAQSGRDPASVHLLAVSKTFPAQAVLEAWQAGQRLFGENYVQEGVEKIQMLQAQGINDIEWHCIGPLQSNKTRLVAEHFAWVHTIERLKIAQRLSEQRPAALPPLQVCIQVNLDGGANKSGVPPEQVLALAQGVAQLPRLQLRGLMCIPEPAAHFDAACQVFTQAQALQQTLLAQGLLVDTLSMGMSADLEAAIYSGSTMVRVGSAVFGHRYYPAAA